VPAILCAKVKVFVELYLLARQAERQALQHIALAEERVARVAAERSTAAPGLTSRARARRSAGRSTSTRRSARSGGSSCRSSPTRRSCGSPAPTSRPRARRSSSRAMAATAIATGRSASRSTARSRRRSTPPRRPGPCQRLPREGEEGRYALPDGATAHAFAALPLAARGRSLAVLGIAMTGARKLDHDALALAGDLAVRAAAAVDNALLYRQIQESDQRKNEFLAMLAHELRNPLAPIANAVHVLKASGEGDRVAGRAT
jgi:GAF domain-containing protein